MDEKQFREFMDVFKSSMLAIQKPGPIQTSTPLILNFETYKKEEKFSQYRERFENFANIKGIQDDKLMLKKTFLNCVGSDMYETIKSINAPESIDKLSYIQIVESLEKYLSPKPNKLIEQHRFLSRVQNETESIGEFVAALRKFLPTCEFNCSCGKSIADMFLQAQFIRGIRDSATREKLFQEADLQFQKAVDIALAFETSRINNREIVKGETSVPNETNAVNRISRSTSRNNRCNYQNKSNNPRSMSRPRYNSNAKHRVRSKSRQRVDFKELGISDLCVKCGRNNHKTEDCRIRSEKLKCDACQKSGHVERVCISKLLRKKRNNNTVKSVETVENNEMSSNYLDFHDVSQISDICTVDLFEMSPAVKKDADKFYVTLRIEGRCQSFEVDSGCGYTLIPKDKFDLFAINNLCQTRIRFRTYDGGIVTPLGTVDVNVQHRNICSKETLFVVPPNHSAIVGRVWIRHLKISLHDLEAEGKNLMSDVFHIEPICLDELVRRFPIAFEQSVGVIPGWKGSLSLRQNSRPVFFKPREIPYAIRSGVEAELEELVKDNIITFVEKSDWGSPLVPVPKPNGKIRLCVDYKVAVNPQLTDAHYPIPRIDYLISQLRNSRYYCKLDLYKAYLHIEMDEESKKIQTISTHKGTFRVNRLSMGIKTAPSEFHRIIEGVLQGLNGVVAYFDDIIVHGESIAQCQENLLACLQRLQDNNLHINKEKCKFFQTRIAYLGFLIEGRNVRKDPRKVKAIVDAPRPTDQKGVKQFLGLVTYYSKFIPNTSTITYPIRQLLLKSRKFKWSTECEAAFKKLKNLIVSDQMLVAYDPKLPVTVACDASPVGIGAVLSHIIDGVERPIAFVSRSLTSAEQNYSQIDREALAIVFALDKFHIYIYGRKFTLITDNRPLTRILHQHAKLPPMTAARLLRYASYLSAFNYEVRHRVNEQHTNVDYLSRFPLSDEKPSPNQVTIDTEVLNCQEETVNQISSAQITSATIEAETRKDPELSGILAELRQSINEESDLTLNGDIIFKGNRVYIPAALRSNILSELHSTHSGITKMKQLARRYCYWPSINTDIEKLVRSCEKCAMSQKLPAKAPLHRWEQPQENFERVHIDYAGPRKGLHFLILVDAKSKWPEIRILSRAPTTESTIALLNDIFSTHGFPRHMVSDNATIFSNDAFKTYCTNNGIFQSYTAPGHPATNGLAERYVQILKSKLSKMEDSPEPIASKVKTILLQFRATPLQEGKSPAELYLNRKIRIRMDAIKPYKPPRNSVIPVRIRELRESQRVQARMYQNDGSKWCLGTVVRRLGRLHYVIRLDNGHTFKRHIDQLRPSEILGKPPQGEKPPKKKQVTFAEEFNYEPVVMKKPDPETSMQTGASKPQQPPNTPRRSAREKRVPARFGDSVYH